LLGKNLTCLFYIVTLYFNRFRRKPAITKFVRTFTPTQSSSQYFAHTRVRSSELEKVLSICNRVDHLVSGLFQLTPIRVKRYHLHLLAKITRRPIIQKVRQIGLISFACGNCTAMSVFSALYSFSFNFPSLVLVRSELIHVCKFSR